MIINLSPQYRPGERLSVSTLGDVITINGDQYDFSPLPDGDEIPVECAHIEGNVKRVGGKVEVTLRIPHDINAGEGTCFPQPIIDPPDGEVALPDPGIPSQRETNNE